MVAQPGWQAAAARHADRPDGAALRRSRCNAYAGRTAQRRARAGDGFGGHKVGSCRRANCWWLADR